MANIDNIRIDLTKMSDNELVDLLKGIRQSRRERKRELPAARTSKAQGSASMDSLISSLTPEMKKELAAQLMGGSDGTTKS